ncbi:MAG TPA: hypothetical protein VGM90_24015 [Kofleriaceae bacterium]
MLSRLASVVVVGCLASTAWAGPNDPIVITTPGDRSPGNIATAASLAGVGLLAGGLGVYFHLDGKSASDDVSAGVYTGKAWTPTQIALVDKAHDDRTRAIVGYSIGGAALIGAIVYWIVTDPPSETTIIQPHSAPAVMPTQGGALLGGTWSF